MTEGAIMQLAEEKPHKKNFYSKLKLLLLEDKYRIISINNIYIRKKSELFRET